MRALGLVALLAGGCIRTSGAFQCHKDTDCANNGQQGECVTSVGYCSFADSTCPTGQRFGSFGGSYAGQCVASPDAGMVFMDAMIDAPDGPLGAPAYVSSFATFQGGANTTTYNFSIPSILVKSFLVVTVQIPSACDGIAPPTTTVTSVSYNGVAMTKINGIVGLDCSATNTRSEQWGLVSPATGDNPVVVQLADVADFHTAAILFEGVNQQTPVRYAAAMFGRGTNSSLDVMSAPNDIVLNTVGQGGSILMPGQNQIFIHNINGGNTLNNSAAEFMIANGTTSTMTWLFGSNDSWQSLSTTLRP